MGLFMTADATERKRRFVSVRQIIILFLSIYVLLTLLITTVFKLQPDIELLLQSIDNLICFVFIADFFYELWIAENRLAYLKWGWIDLVASIPNYPFFWWGRFARVIRILRLLRGIRSVKGIVGVMFESRARGTLAFALMTCFTIAVFASIAILSVEAPLESANIKTAGDAIWWAFSTMSTAGYGDTYPTSAEGRIIATILMTAGVGLFSTATAFIASRFLETDQKEDESRDQMILAEIKALREKIDELERKLK